MSAITHHHPGPRYSRVVVHRGVAYFSGLTAGARDSDVGTQTSEVLAKADDLLAELGIDRSHLLRAMIWLRDIEDFASMNAVWQSWIDSSHPPARATVESALASPDILVEIQFTAAVD